MDRASAPERFNGRTDKRKSRRQIINDELSRRAKRIVLETGKIPIAPRITGRGVEEAALYAQALAGSGRAEGGRDVLKRATELKASLHIPPK